MKRVAITIICAFCVTPLFAQWSGSSTYHNPNGSYGGSARTTQFGNTTQTTFYNQNGSYGGSAQTSGSGASTQTTFYNANGSIAGSAWFFASEGGNSYQGNL